MFIYWLNGFFSYCPIYFFPSQHVLVYKVPKLGNQIWEVGMSSPERHWRHSHGGRTTTLAAEGIAASHEGWG